METLRPIEVRLVEELTGMKSGYVLDFSNRTFEEFFRAELEVEIYGGKFSFEGTSKGSHLRAFLKVSRPADIARALTALWEYREDWIRREGGKSDVPDALPRLNKLLTRLGGPTIADGTAPPAPETFRAPDVIRPSAAELQALRDAFVALHPLAPQPRGVAFERFLSRFFDAWGLQARGSFKNRGEQIDGSFVHSGSTYLLEAKWQDRPVNAQTLHGFQGKVTERPEWTRGLFISYGGFSTEAPEAFTSRRIILMDGTDVVQILLRSLSLVDVIGEKLRHTAERKNPYGKVAELFPE